MLITDSFSRISLGFLKSLVEILYRNRWNFILKFEWTWTELSMASRKDDVIFTQWLIRTISIDQLHFGQFTHSIVTNFMTHEKRSLYLEILLKHFLINAFSRLFLIKQSFFDLRIEKMEWIQKRCYWKGHMQRYCNKYERQQCWRECFYTFYFNCLTFFDDL